MLKLAETVPVAWVGTTFEPLCEEVKTAIETAATTKTATNRTSGLFIWAFAHCLALISLDGPRLEG